MNYQAVLFDCDGVLVDSEPITARVLRDCLEESGWRLSYEECCQIFIGKAVRDERERIERETGQPLTEEWMANFYRIRNGLLLQELLPIDGILEAVAQIHGDFGGRIACASGGDRIKLEIQLGKVGLAPYFGERVFSGQELPRNKPAPDVYLAAADSVQVPPARCIVLEDSVTGATAGVAAGATVIGFSRQGHQNSAEDLRQAGARIIIGHMAELTQAIATLQSSA